MALIVANRVQETTNTTGTGAYTLGGAVAGFQTFASVASDTDTVYYSITDNIDFEVGFGTYSSGADTITRTTVFSSSNSDAAVDWGVGTKNIFLTYPADKAVVEDASNNVTVGNNLVVGGTVDGVDIAARDAVLTSTTNTANAALPKAGGTMSGAIAMGTNKITGAGDPTAAQDLATKSYVDTIAAAGLHYHDPVRVEKEGTLTATYNNGTSGVGATLTNSGTQAALVIDGITMVVADRVLVYEQTDATQNGIYTVTNIGSASTNWVLTRATDADSYAPSDPDSLGQGDAFFVQEGTLGAGETYVMNTEGTITFGTTDITFAQVSSAQVYVGGTGVTIAGTDISIGQSVGTGDDVTFNSVTGNASSATALATGRTIGMTGDVVWTSASFDGTGNVTGTATIQPNSVTLGTDTTGNYVAAGATSGTGISGSVSSEGGTFTVTSNATSANTASTIVARDGSGNFTAGTITGALSGNASTATTLATGRTIGMTGDVVWTSAAFDGSGNVTGTATIQANSVALGTDTTGNYVASIANGSFLTGGGSSAENKAYTLGVDATSANTASKVVARDGSGNFSAGTITAALTGNASTATTLQTARTINGVSFNGSANITVADSTKVPTSRTVSAGSGISGGGALSGNITISHADTSSQGSVDNTGATVIQDVTVDTYGHITGLGSKTLTAADVGAITGNQTITLSGDLSGSGTTSINAQIGSGVVGATELNVTGNGTTAQFLRSDGDGSFTWATPTDTDTTYSAGTALDLSGTTFNVDLSELATSVTDVDGDYFVVVDTSNNQRKLTKGNINISGFNNDSGYSTTTGTVTSVATGGGLTGGTITGSGTLSHADTSSQASVDNSGATVIQDVTLDTYGHVTGLGSHTLTLANLGYTGATNANYITNNNELTNGAGYLTSSSTLNSSNLSGALPAIDGSALTGLAGVPSGVIAMWHGASGSIPSGWNICNGSNGTPNLTGKFIRANTTANGTGGANTHTHSSSLSAGNHTLTTSQMPSHNHAVPVYQPSANFALNGVGGGLSNVRPSRATFSTGGNGAHSHSISGSINSASNVPAYYDLIYIMKA